MPNPTAAMLVIGDEILSGRTRDSNMHHLAQRLTQQLAQFPALRLDQHLDQPQRQAPLQALLQAQLRPQQQVQHLAPCEAQRKV